MKLTNPHDLLFKETLSHKENAISFLQNYLPTELLELIDVESITLEKDSFVTEQMREFFSDLLYQVEILGKVGYVYLLFEHKSYSDAEISLQLLQYMLECWKTKRKQKESKLPLIIPIVIYHSTKEWDIPIRLKDLIEVEESCLLKYLPDFEYLLYELKKPGFESRKAIENLRIMFELFRYGGDDQELLENLEKILKLLKTGQGIDYQFLQTVTIYILHVFEIDMAKYTKEVTRILSFEGGEMVMTTAQRLFLEGKIEGEAEGKIKGKIEGEAEGKIKGRLEEARSLALKLLQKKFQEIPADLRNRLEMVNEPEVFERILEQIFNLEKITEVEGLL